MTAVSRQHAPPAAAAIAFIVLLAVIARADGVLVEPGRPRAPERRRLRLPARSRAPSTASPAASPRSARAIAEIDRLRVDNAALARRERAAGRPRTPGSRRSQRENEQLTGAAPAPGRLRLQDGRRGGHRPRVVRVPAARRRSTRARDDGHRGGRRRRSRAGGALAGRVDRGRAEQRDGRRCSPTATSTVIGQLVDERRDRRGRRPARRASLIMTQIDSSEPVPIGDEVVTAGIELGGGVRSPYPKGLLIGQVVDVRRDANDVVQTAFLQPAADLDRLEYVLVITDYEGGLPPIEQQPVDCGERRRRCPRASSRASCRRAAAPSRAASPTPLTAGVPGGSPLLRFRRDEGHRPRRRDRDPALPADDRHQQAPAADLRPADDLLPDRDAGRDGHPRGAWSSSAARASATSSSCSATARTSGST